MQISLQLRKFILKLTCLVLCIIKVFEWSPNAGSKTISKIERRYYGLPCPSTSA